MTFNSPFMRQAQERGFIHQCSDSDGLDGLLTSNQTDRVCTAYVGFDGTADSLHVGNLLSIMLLRLFQSCGGRPIIVIGDGTTKIGDPSGKEETRQILTQEKIQTNCQALSIVFARFLRFDSSPTGAIILRNSQWLGQLNYIECLRDIGRHFSINRMLGLESVRSRLDREQNLSFLEFNYVILQAYDFLQLYRRHHCQIQMGGSDQWGNIVSGIELARRADQAELFALTCPLLLNAQGQKMGKTHQGALWLNADKLSPFDYWQFWRNVDDKDVGRFLRLFTDKPVSEIEELEGDDDINAAKKVLANAATALCHGPDEGVKAAANAAQIFEKGGSRSDLPAIDIAKDRMEKGLCLFALLVEADLTSTRSAARRLIRGGGARINGQVVKDDGYVIDGQDFGSDGRLQLSAGKKRHKIIVLRP